MRMFGLVLLFAVGCGASPTYNWAAEREAGYRVGPAVVVKVNAWKDDELSQQVAVRPDGALTMPLIGDVRAEGKTVEEIAGDIGQRVHRFFQDQPPVTVQIAEVRSYKVYVVGEVQRGGE